MRKTMKDYNIKPTDKKMVDTTELRMMLCSGRQTAVEIGTAAKAIVQIGGECSGM